MKIPMWTNGIWLDDKRDSLRWGVYFQDEIEILENLAFHAGARYDDYANTGGTTNPRLALIYNPFKKTTLKFLYGEAFRAPNAFEFYYNDVDPDNLADSTQKANPGLLPETITSREIALEQSIGKNLRAIVTGFHYKIDNLIAQEVDPADGLLVYRNNNGEILTNGFEAEIEGKWDGGYKGRISYSLQDTENAVNGTTPPNSPKHLAKLNFILPFINEKLFLGTEVRYMGKRTTLANNGLDGFALANLTLFSGNLIKGLEASGSIYNLFNRKYKDPVSDEHSQDSLTQNGRTYRLKLIYSW